MSLTTGKRQIFGMERLKRWLRISVLNRQSHDLFYPLCPQDKGPLATAQIRLVAPRKAPHEVFINGRKIVLADVVRSGSDIIGTVVPPEAVLPGENVVSLPVACDPAAVEFAGTEPLASADIRLGWMSADEASVNTEDLHLAAAASFLVNSLSADIFGQGQVSLTTWDPEAQGVRLWSWYWTTGIVYEALESLTSAGAMTMDLSPLEQGLLSRQIVDGSERHGSYMVRWDPDRTLRAGIVPWHAPNDCAYLGLHGLLVAHRRTGDPAWLERSVALADWITEHGMRDGRLRVGWDDERQRWDDSWHYIDAAWTPAFFLALSEATGEIKYAQTAEALTKDTIERFATDGPFLLKIWRANGRHTETVFARGMAWVLEGWLPMLVAGNDWLRPRIQQLVMGLMDHQQEDGAWPYLLDQPNSGSCNKGTPALAYHLNRAKPLFPELADRIEKTVDSALRWCETHMDLAAGSPCRGGIIAGNDEGAIVTVRGIPTAFNYGAAYYILTRQERSS